MTRLRIPLGGERYFEVMWTDYSRYMARRIPRIRYAWIQIGKLLIKFQY